MTHQYTKLAEALVEIANSESNLRQDERDSCSEAARILRAAAGADVAGLMAMHDAAAEARRVLVRGGDVPRDEADRSRQTRAALESALRLVLAQRVPTDQSQKRESP